MDHLGFNKDNIEVFIQRIHAGIKNSPASYEGKASETNNDKWLIKINMSHATKKGEKWPVVTVWQNNNGNPKIITAYCET